ncbi:MAG TPA: serine/threonine-protein kinase [Gemmataceae bacterium]|nr:serine/threonine-protein kinase [Gemmataceae bacterium]
MADSTDPADRYSVLWHSGNRPDLDAFLASAGPLSARQLADLVCTDQRERWRAGDRVRVEAYFQRFPRLRSDPALALDLVYAEVLMREGDGSAADADLSARFPDLAPALRVQVDLHRALAARPAPADDDPLPARFGRYEIRRPLGRGGMGTVYLAHDTQLNRLVALKVPLLDSDPGSARQFVREARAAAALQHPNICPVYDAGEIDGRPFLTMAYLEGEPLSARVRRGPLPVAEAVRLVRTMAEALDGAHRAGIVHRDLKPANVLHNAKGQPVITDFGLARNLMATSGDSQSGRQIVGTPNYMAPEQVNGDPGAGGPAVDIYALGVVLYELLTGARPFDGPLGTVLARITTDDPEPPSRRRPEVDSRLSAICLTALAKSPADRYPSMDAFASALDGWLAGRPASARRRRPNYRALVAPAVLVVLLAGGVLVWRPWKSGATGGDPPAPAARDPQAADALADRAWAFNDGGNLDGAIDHSTRALALDDQCVKALLCRANARLQKMEVRAAIADLDRAATLAPGDHQPEVDLAWAYHELGDHDAALAHANRALQLKPSSEEAYYQRGGAHLNKRMYREAVADLTEAIRLKADYAMAYRDRAAAYRGLGQDALAERDEKAAAAAEAAGGNPKR